MRMDTGELMLLSRSGHVPSASRAGPRERATAQLDAGPAIRPQAPRSVALLARAAAGCRRAVGRHGHRGAGAPGRTRPGYAQRDSYIELEFAVGFGAEEEPWL